MRLITDKIHMNKCHCEEEANITIDRDINVPDARPDVLRIVKDKGDVQIDEIRLVEGKAVIRGELKYQVLYVVDGDASANQISGSLPIDERISLPCAEPDDELSVKVGILKMQCELIHSRKLGIHAEISISVTATTICDIEGATDVEDGDGVYTQKKDIEVSRLVFSKKDTLRIGEEWKIPATNDAIGQLLYWDIRLAEMNTRVEEGTLKVEGETDVFIIYLSDGTTPRLNYFENVIPIEGKIQCNGCHGDMAAWVLHRLHGSTINVKEDEDGESRVLAIDIVTEYDIKIYKQEQLELLSDFYALDAQYELSYEDAIFQNLLVHNKGKSRIDGKLTTDDAAPLQIWNVEGTLSIDHTEQRTNQWIVSGVISVCVLYQTEDEYMPLAVLRGDIPFSQQMDAEGMTKESDVDFSGTLEHISGTICGEREIEIKVVASIDLIAFEHIKESIISGYDGEPRDYKDWSKYPGIVGYVVGRGETMWDIAKRFVTTQDALMEINKRESTEVSEGDTLLVVREMGDR